MAHVHGIGVHNPCHGLFVGVDVGSGHVFFRPDEIDDLGCVAARHALQLALTHLFGVADDSALGSAKRDVDDCALPGHPTGQRAHFVERDVGRVADAAFGGSAGNGVLNPKAGEDLDVAVVHGYWKVDDNFARGSPEQLPKAFI